MNGRLRTINFILKCSKRKFSSNYNFHHDFSPEHIPATTPLNVSLLIFDYLRFTFYVSALLVAVINLPLYLAYGKSKQNFVSNPDYLLDIKLDK